MWRFCLALLLLLVLHPAATVATETETEIICGSMELRQIADFAQMRNCSMVVGHVRIVNIELPEKLDLAQLRSEVSIITDYLLIYRTNGLLTVESIFPRLRLIRGQALLFDQYALTVYENRHLMELGLVELLRIQSGNIRIESNPMLCFVESVNWVYLLGNSTQQHFSIKYNKSPNHCPLCGGLSADYAYRQNDSVYCWNMHSTQLRPTPPRLAGCPEDCGLNGCDFSGNCCKRSCLTGCSDQNCSLCANLQSDGHCVDQCIPRYQLNRRDCITQRECRQRGLIPLTRGYSCVHQCPDHQRPMRDANGSLYCQLHCSGVYHVQRSEDLSALQDCVTINGSLIIELANIKEKIVAALEDALGSIKEITGYLKILRSAQLMSLSFLKSLDTIRGDQLIEHKYALSVVDNHHLEQIWAPNRQVAIQHGSIFFHLNPRLCYEKVLQLQPALKSAQKISVADVSPNSNGERIICGSSVRTLDATVEDLNATAARIAVNFMSWDDMETLIGYSYHYMEAPQRNVTMYDGRHGCGHDNWLMDISPSKNRRHIIAGLKPYTQYAFFVKTLTRTDYHMQIDAYSSILYFRTLPSRPSSVARLYGSSQLSTEIMLHWWPPRRPNGVIEKYIISFEALNATKEEGRNYFTVPSGNNTECMCQDVLPYDSGPQPEDEHYYNKEQITYEDALPNLIYVSRRKDNIKKEKFDRVKDYEDLISIPVNVSSNSPTPTTAPVAANITANQTTVAKNVTDFEAQAAKQYELYRLQMEEKLRLAQDTGIDDFLIVKPSTECAVAHASMSYRLEQKCDVAEEISGIEVSGSKHFYWLKQLKPDQVYSISVRACLANTLNGCSTPKVAKVKTISKDVEEFMRGQSGTL